MLLKKYSDFGRGKKKSDSEFLSYNNNRYIIIIIIDIIIN